jgi:ABC-2 type transport system permease protein
MAFINDLNLDDLLFRYGVRVNPVLVQDIQCNVIPVNVALSGNAPNFQPAPWLYYPLMAPSAGHPVSQNLNFVLGKFVNSIDTLAARNEIHKTPLLATSPYSRERKAPLMVSLEEIKDDPQQSEFDNKTYLTGVLLEGEFESAFTNRGMERYFDGIPEILEKSIKTRMAVIADGDVIANEFKHTAHGVSISPLGYDRYTRQTFGNKDFLVNLVQFLGDDNNLLSLRNRRFKLRLLDRDKIQTERQKWILINMIAPSLLVILFGAGFVYYRKYRFAR